MNPLAWLAGHPLIMALIAAVSFSGIQTYRISSLKADVRAEKNARITDISTWRAAGVIATLKATQAARTREAAQTRIYEANTNDYQKRLAAFSRAFDGRVRPSPADHSGSSGTHLPAIAYDPTVYYGPGADRGISESDARICAVNTLRLIAARQWALDLSK